MKSINLSKNSWHWRLAHTYAQVDYWKMQETDFCTYSQYVLRGAFAALAIVLLAGMIAAPAGGFIGWIAAMLSLGQVVPPDDLAIAFMAVVFVLGAIGLGVLFAKFSLKREDERLSRRWDNNYVPPKKKEPSFFALLYRKLKEKTCIKVNLT